MSLPVSMTRWAVPTVLGKRSLQELYRGSCQRPFVAPPWAFTVQSRTRGYATVQDEGTKSERTPASTPPPSSSSSTTSPSEQSTPDSSRGADMYHSHPHEGKHRHGEAAPESMTWDENPDLSISKFSELPSKNFGVNQHIIINEEFKEALRQILWQFRAPIRYAFAYGSGVFPQSASTSNKSTLHPNPPEAISKEHRDHYSAVGSLGSYAVSKLQDSVGAGVYFNPYITVNGTLIKYGVVNLDTLCKDLSEWNSMYIAGRLQKPVKILRDNPSVRLANQVNLISAVRTALLLLPAEFTEQQLYSTIAGISYMGDPRMSVGGDDPRKVSNIVKHQLPNFRRLYAPLIDNLPNISFTDSQCSHPEWMDDASINAKLAQNMDPETRGNMVRRLPTAFRGKLYFEYQAKWKIPRRQFQEMMDAARDDDEERIRKREGGPFEQRIAKDEDGGGLREEVKQVIEKTIQWPAFTQSLKGVVTAGVARSWRYVREKRAKGKAGAAAQTEEAAKDKGK